MLGLSIPQCIESGAPRLGGFLASSDLSRTPAAGKWRGAPSASLPLASIRTAGKLKPRLSPSTDKLTQIFRSHLNRSRVVI